MDALASLTERLPDGAVSTHPGELTSRSRDAWPLAMLREARGERLPRPMAVVFPRSTEDVSATLAWAVDTGTAVVPRGGGSGLTGAAQAEWRGIVLDLSFLNRVLGVDRESRTVEVEAGTHGDRLEAALGREGLTLGHDPQSLSFSSVGGWIASSSAGHTSAGFGAIGDLVLGLDAVLAGGDVLRLPAVPRPSAGPDLRRLLIGSEGTLAVITRATLAVAPVSEGYRWRALLFRRFEEGIDAAREVAQSTVRPLMLRLFDDADAASAFGDLGHEDGAVLLLGFGEDGTADGRAGTAVAMAEAAGGSPLPEDYGERWWDHRNDGAGLYRRIMGEERMLGPGVVVDTVQVEAPWSALPRVYPVVRRALAEHAARPVTAHLTHPHPAGAALSFGFLLHGQDDQAAEARYLRCWEDAARACREAGGSLGHGVGLLRSPFLEGEIGAPGVAVLRAVKNALDPHGVLNPGKLLPG
ncbi:MAG TPA: FAD-binding oxidoreductase [Actinomycetota bacterium]|nr:FAD-binding oxidoreductase [Actinomycetota bacterium]